MGGALVLQARRGEHRRGGGQGPGLHPRPGHQRLRLLAGLHLIQVLRPGLGGGHRLRAGGGLAVVRWGGHGHLHQLGAGRA